MSNKLATVTEENTNTETAITVSNPATPFSDDLSQLSFNDFPVPRLQLMQGSSDLVKKPAPDGYPRPMAGNFVVPIDDGNNGYYLADEVHIVVLSLKKHFTSFYKRDGVDVFESWPVDPHNTDQPSGTVHQDADPKLTFSYVVLVIDPTSKHEPSLAQIDMSKSNLGAAKNINAALRRFGFKSVALKLTAKFNDTVHSYYSLVVSASDIKPDQVAEAITNLPF